jgi:hypothetical protein
MTHVKAINPAVSLATGAKVGRYLFHRNPLAFEEFGSYKVPLCV